MNTLQLRGTLLVALSGALFGCMGYLGTQLLNLQFSIENMLFWRFFLASLCLLMSIGILNKHTLLKNYSFPLLLKILIWGSLSYSASTAAYFVASQYVETGLSMVLLFSFPIFVCLFAWGLGRWRFNFYATIALLAMIIGLICLREPDHGIFEMTGILFGLISAIAYAVYVYNSKYNASNIDPQWLTFLVCVGNTIVFFIWTWSAGSFTVPHSLEAWGYFALLAIFATVLPMWLLLEGLQYISSVKASILSVLEPVFTLFLGMVLLSEVLSLLQLIGVIVILLAAIIIQFERTGEGKEQ